MTIVIIEIHRQIAEIERDNRKPTTIYMGSETYLRFAREVKLSLVPFARKRDSFMGCDIYHVDELEHLKVTW